MTRDLTPPTRCRALLSRLRLLLLCVAAVPLMSGCAWICKFCQGQSQTPKQVAVVIFDAAAQRAVVLPDPINYRLSDGPGFIEWRLPAGSGLRFPRQGAIVLNAKDGGAGEIVNCEPVGDDGLAHRCLDRATREGRFKYDIVVIPPGAQRPVVTDPTIVNRI